MTTQYRNRLLHAVWAFRFGRYDDMKAEEALQVLAGAAERLLAENPVVADEPVRLTLVPVQCSICCDPNCDNPGGKH